MGFEPMNTGFADQRVSHFAIGAFVRRASQKPICATVQLSQMFTAAAALSANTASPFCSRGRSSLHRRWKQRR
jgi:hypothetical protein